MERREHRVSRRTVTRRVRGEDPVVREAVSALTGTSPAREAIELVGDVIRGRRARTQIKILRKTMDALKEANRTPHVVPDKTLVPLLETAGLEDEGDDEMVERWANLLANASVTPAGGTLPPAYPRILHELEPIEPGCWTESSMLGRRWGKTLAGSILSWTSSTSVAISNFATWTMLSGWV